MMTLFLLGCSGIVPDGVFGREPQFVEVRIPISPDERCAPIVGDPVMLSARGPGKQQQVLDPHALVARVEEDAIWVRSRVPLPAGTRPHMVIDIQGRPPRPCEGAVRTVVMP